MMTTKLTKLLGKITPLPYQVSGQSIVSGQDICIAVIEDDGGYEAPSEQRDANSTYLVHASNVLPALVEAAHRFLIAGGKVSRLRVTSCGKQLEDAENEFIEASLGLVAAIDDANNVKSHGAAVASWDEQRETDLIEVSVGNGFDMDRLDKIKENLSRVLYAVGRAHGRVIRIWMAEAKNVS